MSLTKPARLLSKSIFVMGVLVFLLSSPGKASAQDRIFRSAHTHAASDALASQIILSDMDGDRDLDLVTADFLVGCRVQFNDATGAFSGITVVPPQDDEGAGSIAVGDVDGDGDNDIMFTNINGIRHALNDGFGGFTDASANFPDDSEPVTKVVLGDIDRDGDLDAIATYYRGRDHRLYRNDGFGLFSDSGLLLGQGPVSDVDLGDVNGDGWLDVFITYETYTTDFGDTIRSENVLLINNGGTSFVPSNSLPDDREDSVNTEFGDIEGDGDLDIYVGNNSEPDRIYLNDGTGSYADPGIILPDDGFYSRGFTLADFDSDGDLDVITSAIVPLFTSSPARLLVNDGLGNFLIDSRPLTTSSAWGETAAGDLDSDGDVDVCFATHTGIGVYYQVDKEVSSVNERLAVMPHLVDPRAGSTFPFHHQRHRFVFADFDQNGDLDALAISNGTDNVFFYLNDGTGRFRNGNRSRVPPGNPGVVETGASGGDFDADGDIDILITTLSSHPSLLLENDGSGFFADVSNRLPQVNETSWDPLFADLDNDGDQDILFSHGLYLNAGDVFLDGSGNLPGGSSSNCDVGDIDLDGDLDIYFATPAPNTILLALNDGTGVFSNASNQIPQREERCSDGRFGDVDGDGDLDLVTANLGANTSSSGQNGLFLNGGSGFFLDASSQLPQVIDDTRELVLADFDEDGDLDIVFANDRGWDRYCENDGHGQFSEVLAPEMRMRNSDFPITAADFDGDGDIDLLNGVIRYNKHRHLSWRTLPRIGRELTLDLSGAPFGRWAILVGRELDRIPMGSLGVLRLNPEAVFEVFTGTLDAFGEKSLSVRVPADSILEGMTLYGQGLIDSPGPHLSNLEVFTFFPH